MMTSVLMLMVVGDVEVLAIRGDGVAHVHIHFGFCACGPAATLLSLCERSRNVRRVFSQPQAARPESRARASAKDSSFFIVFSSNFLC